jgi:hypothetical protein
MKTYEIKYEPITIDGKVIDKYNIYYYIDNVLENKEFYGYNLELPLIKIRENYNLKTK